MDAEDEAETKAIHQELEGLVRSAGGAVWDQLAPPLPPLIFEEQLSSLHPLLRLDTAAAVPGNRHPRLRGAGRAGVCCESGAEAFARGTEREISCLSKMAGPRLANKLLAPKLLDLVMRVESGVVVGVLEEYTHSWRDG
ncbi:hypothetical protein B0O99DRAFT_685256 [Bisporella sp. PMI_857]|nr:hypothetical protein B0O99DRAFT_685256 [Bisporella sp. PMI_857]